MLRVSGIWISPAEIEDALAGIASIAETAAVLGESDDRACRNRALCRAGGRGRRRGRRDCGRAQRLSQVLPRYKLPRRFEVVADLPRTATGKVQRHKLRERLAARTCIEAGIDADER